MADALEDYCQVLVAANGLSGHVSTVSGANPCGCETPSLSMVISPQLMVWADVTAGLAPSSRSRCRSADGCGGAVEVDLGAAHGPLAAVLLDQQPDEVAAVPEVAAADAVAIALSVSQVERERRAGLVDDGLNPAAGNHVQVGFAAVADDQLMIAVASASTTTALSGIGLALEIDTGPVAPASGADANQWARPAAVTGIRHDVDRQGVGLVLAVEAVDRLLGGPRWGAGATGGAGLRRGARRRGRRTESSRRHRGRRNRRHCDQRERRDLHRLSEPGALKPIQRSSRLHELRPRQHHHSRC